MWTPNLKEQQSENKQNTETRAEQNIYNRKTICKMQFRIVFNQLTFTC